MDLADSPDEAAFRAAARDWLATALPRLPWPEPSGLTGKAPFWRQYQRLLFDAGYAGLSWPREYGGAEADAKLRAIFTEECDRAGAPERLNTIGEDFAGPTIIDFGTEEQKQRFLRPILTGDEIWCQLFSEPEAGSDLASLRTRAERADGGWRIQGQKIWTSRAHLAAHAILLARTGGGDRHRGITYFILPMDTPGITVRPLAHMLGEAEFNEVFLDDVFIPDDLVVGDVDGGWKVAMATLSYERVAIAT
ncbi:MAG TPA: acyl-CoA dehydrogenase family protein, partial [Streptosporangiaceae bacterium]|nr:acyl-CoA dehydrogenase family protein [Streptosporangiaceae bacterium]